MENEVASVGPFSRRLEKDRKYISTRKISLFYLYIYTITAFEVHKMEISNKYINIFKDTALLS
jgi:hypothetical protein